MFSLPVHHRQRVLGEADVEATLGEGVLHERGNVFRPIAQRRHLQVDDAQAVLPPTLQMIQSIAGTDRLLFGTDYPYVGTRQQLDELSANLSEKTALRMIRHDNARLLMPHLSAD